MEVDARDECGRQDRETQDRLARNVLSFRAVSAGGAHATADGLNGLYQPMSDLDDRRDPTDDHRAHADIADLGAPQFVGAVDGILQKRLRTTQKGNADEPGHRTTKKDQQRDVQPHDIPHSDERWRYVASKEKEPIAGGERALQSPFEDTEVADRKFYEHPDQATLENGIGAARPLVRSPRFQDRRTGHALGIGQFIVVSENKNPAHRDHKENPQEPARKRDQGRKDHVEFLPDPDQNQGGHGEDDSGSE